MTTPDHEMSGWCARNFFVATWTTDALTGWSNNGLTDGLATCINPFANPTVTHHHYVDEKSISSAIGDARQEKMQSSQFLLIPHLLLSSHRQQLSEHRRHPYRLSFRYLISTADNSPIRNTKERLINDISVPKSTPLTRDQEQKSKKDGDQQKKKIKKNDQKIGGFDIEEENFIDKNVGRFDFG
uniref:Uncharacterized protein n=1 Tax=Lactuca sativa TaxID=4236 RepID=A0A9R1XM99_LACSA|nr:hypothetical protein LSAT_V11C200054360 [Lactuca sativa]